MGAIASQITSLTIVYSTFYSEADQRKHQSSASLAFVRGIQWGPVNSPHKCPVTRKMFPFDDVIMFRSNFTEIYSLGSKWQYDSISSDNGLAPNRRQAINCSNDGMFHWCIYASLGLNDSVWIHCLTNIGIAIIKIRQLWDQIRPSCLFNGNSYSGKTHLYIELTPCHFMVIVAMALMCIPGASFNMSMSSYQYRNPIVEIRWSYDHLISKMGFPILVRWHLYVELAPRK